MTSEQRTIRMAFHLASRNNRVFPDERDLENAEKLTNAQVYLA